MLAVEDCEGSSSTSTSAHGNSSVFSAQSGLTLTGSQSSVPTTPLVDLSVKSKISMSRSRSRTGRDSPPPVDPNEPVPNLPSSHSSRAREDSMGQAGPSKPTTRIQSRPLSSTTTATNATVTPGTPRAKRNPPSAIPIATKDFSPRQETPKVSARTKLHNLFGIPMSSPKKPSFTSSNHSSRRPSVDEAPPVPSHGNHSVDNDPTPKASKSIPPPPHSRPESPSVGARQKLGHPHNQNTNTGPFASGSSRLQRFLAGGPKTYPSTDDVSAPIIRRLSTSSHRRNNSSNSTSNHSSPSSDAPPPPVKAASSARPPTSTRVSTAHQVTKSSSLGHSSHKNSVDSNHDSGVDGLGNLNGHTRVKLGHTHTHSRRSTKHGSFDFERPGWSAAMQRSASGGSGTSGTGTWAAGLDGMLGGVRESAMGPGLAGVGTLQRDVSLKRGKEREEMVSRIKEEERRKRRAEPHGPKHDDVAQEFGVLPSRSQTLRSGSRTASPEDGRTTGKFATSGKKSGGLLGKAKLPTFASSHGPFAFEPPVSSPTWSTTSTTNGQSNGKKGKSNGNHTPLTVSWANEKTRDKSRIVERDKERWMERAKERRSQSANRGDRAPVPVPVPVASATMGHRSGTKGRSLDLGLGLSWAPSSVREDALLPSTTLFTRSTSGSSSLGSRSVARSVSGSANGHATIEEERSVLGSEVAKVFKSALDDAGYKSFKRYVDRFDAHEIPFDGPTGIVSRVERLLKSAPCLSDEGKRQLLDNFIRVVLQHA
ncbi:hypothetical protein H0H93_000041 [Arthromyces matolae]|nr:hypothetical protein H0H93_000041 [Arthromyces matolae]